MYTAANLEFVRLFKKVLTCEYFRGKSSKSIRNAGLRWSGSKNNNIMFA